MNSLRIINKKEEKVLSSTDCALFYLGRGNDNSSAEGKPTGIVNSSYTTPFALVFDNANLKVYLNPGIAQIYGRQIELNAQMEAYDFHATALAARIYCNIYLELNLEDSVNQKVTLKMSLNGGNYKNFFTNGIQDNLQKLGHGVYQAPLNHFIYTPGEEEPFSDEGFDMVILDGECRQSTRSLDDESLINDVPVPTLGTVEDGIFKFEHADNSNGIAWYESSDKKETSPGYSVADGTERIGLGEGSTSIDSQISGLQTVARIKLCNITNLFGMESCDIRVRLSIDWAHIQAIRLWFKNPNFKCRGKYRGSKTSTLGIPGWINQIICDTDINAEDNGGEYRDKVFIHDYWLQFNEGANGTQPLYLNGDFHHEGYSKSYLTLQSARGDNNYIDVTGIPLGSYIRGTHTYATIQITKESATRGMFRVKGEPGTGDLSWWIAFLDWGYYNYFSLDSVERAGGEVWADFIYKGNVDLT